MTTTPDSFTLERTWPNSPQRLFAVLSQAELKSRWYGPEGNATATFSSDFRVGGREYHSYALDASTPFPGVVIEHEGTFADIVENERIVLATSMSFGGKRVSTALVTFLVSPAGEGARLTLIHQAVFYDGADGPAMRRAGWETLMDTLHSVFAA